MASSIADGPGVKVTKRYRLTDRWPSGTVVYSSVDDLGGESQLYVKPDGSMYTYELVGVCKYCMVGQEHACKSPRGATPTTPVAVPETAPETRVTPPTDLRPEPVPEPEPVPKPEPVPAAPVDPQYEPWKPERKSALSRALSWGPGY